MNDFKLFDKCRGCKQRKLFVAKRTTRIPGAGKAVSKDYFCGKCAKLLKRIN